MGEEMKRSRWDTSGIKRLNAAGMRLRLERIQAGWRKLREVIRMLCNEGMLRRLTVKIYNTVKKP